MVKFSCQNCGSYELPIGGQEWTRAGYDMYKEDLMEPVRSMMRKIQENFRNQFNESYSFEF